MPPPGRAVSAGILPARPFVGPKVYLLAAQACYDPGRAVSIVDSGAEREYLIYWASSLIY